MTGTPSWPVVEMFGPTIQGEGVDQGVVCSFIRFGGCDFRCSWCDTPHAVLPSEVRENATKMGVRDIQHKLWVLNAHNVPWIILSGGNPALHNLEPLVDRLHDLGYLVAVETQGSLWKSWLCKVDRLCVSPKPPSSGESKSTMEGTKKFLSQAALAQAAGLPHDWMFVKVVCFNNEDLGYATQIRREIGGFPLYLSAGNDAGRTVGNSERVDNRDLAQVRSDLMDKSVWLVHAVFDTPDICRAPAA